jgi:hypothetical protein
MRRLLLGVVELTQHGEQVGGRFLEVASRAEMEPVLRRGWWLEQS